ncbi:hypothetical protein [Candidatus Hodarchaeum mangrovi]
MINTATARKRKISKPISRREICPPSIPPIVKPEISSGLREEKI